MKKIISLMLTVAICLSLAVPAFAASTFSDVPHNAYFKDAVDWAVNNNVTAGIGNNQFGPNQSCTRAQTMTFLWRAHGSPEPKNIASGTAFSDVNANDYFAKPIAWAVENGITAGIGNNQFGSNQKCTRGQVMTFIWRAENSPIENGKTQFSDVHSNDYYNHAIAWAVNHGVTAGVGANKFGPNQSCTRAQIVTFLWRADSIDSNPEKPVEPPKPTEPVAPPTTPTEPSHPVEPERPTDPVEPPKHEHNYIVFDIIPPTCTEDGYTIYQCLPCNSQYHADIVPATGHLNTETYEKSPTCGKHGYKRVYCDDCRKTISEEIYPATEKHNYQWHTASEAASVAMDHWSGEYGGFLGYDDWDVKMCENCYHLDLDTLKSKYTDDEAARVMLEQYVNPLRKEVYGTDEYAMTIDSTLMELAKIRAIEIVTDYNHNAWFNAGENITHAACTIKGDFEMWNDSQKHRENMLNREYKYFGYARYYTNGDGHTTLSDVFAVQLFWSQYGKDNYIPRN